MGLVDDDQANIVDFYLFFLQPVVEGFDHGHKAHKLILVGEFLDLAIDYLVSNPKTIEHFRGLDAQFDSVGQYNYLFTGFFDIPTGDL